MNIFSAEAAQARYAHSLPATKNEAGEWFCAPELRMVKVPGKLDSPVCATVELVDDEKAQMDGANAANQKSGQQMLLVAAALGIGIVLLAPGDSKWFAALPFGYLGLGLSVRAATRNF